MLNSLNKIMSLGMEEIREDLDGVENNVVVPSESHIVDASTNVDVAIMDTEENNVEVLDFNKSIQFTEQVADSIVDINEAVEKTVADDGVGLKPQAAEVLDIAVECLKSIIGYKGNRKLPSMESFGGTMPRKKATTLAVEDLSSLTIEIKTQLDKAYIMRYSSNIESIQKNISNRELLLGYVKSTLIKAQEFFNTDRYNPELNGKDLPKGNSYINRIFNLDESTDGKMSSAAVISGLESFKSGFGLNAHSDLIKQMRLDIQSMNNDVNLTKETHDSFIKPFLEKFNTLISSTKKFDNGYQIVSSAEIPLGGGKVTLKSSKMSNDPYWYGSSSIEKLVLPEGLEPTLGALSNVETDQILNSILTTIQTNEVELELVGLIEDMILFCKTSDALNNKADTDISSNNDTVCYCSTVKYIADEIINFFTMITGNEIKTYNALVNYCNDSLALHSSNVEPVTSNTQPVVEENTTVDTNTPTEENNSSESSTDTSEDTSETTDTE